MSDYGAIWAQVRREQETEEKVRSLDAAEIVKWIHELEDKIESLEDEQDD